MSLQKKVLKQYLDFYGKKTFKQISEETGIQLTRVFRIMNGYPMKLPEYEIFQKLIQGKSIEKPMEEELETCGLEFSSKSMERLKKNIHRTLRLKQILNVEKLDNKENISYME